MLKIINALLAGKQLDAKNVMKLISNLPEGRQEVAVEMALGIYEEPEFQQFTGQLVSLKESKFSEAIPARIIEQSFLPMDDSIKLVIDTPEYKSLECPFKPGSTEFVDFAKKIAKLDSYEAYEFGSAYAGQHQRFRLKTFKRKTMRIEISEFEKISLIGCVADMDKNFMTHE